MIKNFFFYSYVISCYSLLLVKIAVALAAIMFNVSSFQLSCNAFKPSLSFGNVIACALLHRNGVWRKRHNSGMKRKGHSVEAGNVFGAVALLVVDIDMYFKPVLDDGVD